MNMQNWPSAALDALKEEKSESPHGCGDCTNAGWGSSDDVGENQRFHVISCEAGINLLKGDPLKFCPFRNVKTMLQAGQVMGQHREGEGARNASNPPPLPQKAQS